FHRGVSRPIALRPMLGKETRGELVVRDLAGSRDRRRGIEGPVVLERSSVGPIGEVVKLLWLPRRQAFGEVPDAGSIARGRDLRGIRGRIAGEIECFGRDHTGGLMIAMILADDERREPGEDNLGPSEADEADGPLERVAVTPGLERLEYILTRRVLAVEEPGE